MDPAEAAEFKALSRQDAMNSVIDRFESPVQQFYCGAVVFVTGGSGFLGKQLVEKLFRSTKLKAVYLLIRYKKGKTACERLSEVLQDPVYNTLHKEQASFVERIVPIEGDVTQIGLGISDDSRNKIIEEVNMIFHVAATIRFDEPLGAAAITNVRGTREILNLARECKKLRSFVHVSTGYSHATLANLGEQVLEQFYPSPVPPDVIIQLAETLDEETLNQITPGLIKGWPNTYSFTKALAEELIRTTAGDLPICIMRPTIVICTNCEPMPGWIDMSSVLGPSGLTLGTTIGVIHTLLVRQDIKIDFVPMDFVNNACVVAAWETDRRRQAGERDTKIYTLSSSARNHITWGELTTHLENVRGVLLSPQTMWYCFAVQTTNPLVFLVLRLFLHDIPATIIDTALLFMGRKPRLRKIYSTFNKMSVVLRFFINNDWVFDDKNTLELYNSLSRHDRDIYNFDIANVEWTEQVQMWYVGLRKYILKDGLKGTEEAVKRQLYFKIATCVYYGLLFCVIGLLLCYLYNKVMYVIGFYY